MTYIPEKAREEERTRRIETLKGLLERADSEYLYWCAIEHAADQNGNFSQKGKFFLIIHGRIVECTFAVAKALGIRLNAPKRIATLYNQDLAYLQASVLKTTKIIVAIDEL